MRSFSGPPLLAPRSPIVESARSANLSRGTSTNRRPEAPARTREFSTGKNPVSPPQGPQVRPRDISLQSSDPRVQEAGGVPDCSCSTEWFPIADCLGPAARLGIRHFDSAPLIFHLRPIAHTGEYARACARPREFTLPPL